MAKDKNAIIVYADWINKFEELTDEEAGKLIKHFFRYVNDLNPTAPDRLTKLMFLDLQNSLKRDLEKWEKKLDERSVNGRLGNLKRYNSDIYEKVISEKITLEEGENLAKSRKISHGDKKPRTATKDVAKLADSVSDSVSDSVTVSVSVSDSDILLEKETKEILVVDLQNQPKHPKIDFENIKNYFNENRGAMPELRLMSENRIKKIKSLEKKYGLDLIFIAIQKARASDMMQGINSRNWVATFDWIIKTENFIKIIEDNYVNRTNTTKSNQQIFNDAATSEIGKNFRFS